MRRVMEMNNAISEESIFHAAADAACGIGLFEQEMYRNHDSNRWNRSHVFDETNRVFLESAVPSKYFRILNDCGALKPFFPEIDRMRGIEQDKQYHPEGDVFQHTMLVLDCAAELRRRAEHPLWFMYSALLHDVGKCVATVTLPDGRIRAYGHEVLGDELLVHQINCLTDDSELLNYIINQVHLHMRPNMMAAGNSRKKKTRAMFDMSICPNDLILLTRADASGKTDVPYREETEQWLRDRLDDYMKRAGMPMVTGQDLMRNGIEEGEILHAAVLRARQLHFSGIDRKKALNKVLQEFGRK